MKTISAYIHQYKDYLTGLKYKKSTVRGIGYALSQLVNLTGDKAVYDITEDDIKDFYNYIKTAKSKYSKKVLASQTIDAKINSIKQFFNYLIKIEALLVNPMDKMEIKIDVINKVRDIFSIDEINQFLDSIDLKDVNGRRDRAIFELMYSSAIRESEARNVKISDLDFYERILKVKQGKGSKDRFVPFSDVAEYFVKRYINKERVKNRLAKQLEYVFLTGRGQIKYHSMRDSFYRILSKINVGNKNLTPHSIRHSTATHLLESGADVRYVQELLGHESLRTTVKYTHLMTDSLRRMYNTYHPRENEYFQEIDEDYYNNVKKFKKEHMDS